MPTGKQEVVTALLDAATELFAEHGPGAVSVRDVATRAGVNHGLVHRHFGSKDGLVQAVLDRLVTDLRARYAAGFPTDISQAALFEELSANDTYWRVLARALLDGQTDWLDKASFPLIRAGVDYLETALKAAGAEPDLDAQAMLASYLAAALGWLVFEPFIAAATGMKGSAKSRQKRLLAVWDRLENAALGARTR